MITAPPSLSSSWPPSWPSPRVMHAAGLIVCVGALLVAVLFMEKYLGLAPCPLCVLDRVVIVLMAAVFLLAFLHDPGFVGQRVYAGVNVLLGATGVALAWRHVYLQGLPPGEVPDCAPDLDYMLEAFPLSKTLSTVLNSSGECAEISWTFLGLSIAQQTLLLFVLLTLLCAVIFKTAPR